MKIKLNSKDSLEVKPGRVFIVLGQQGTGKSNLVKLVMQGADVDKYVIDPSAEYGDVETRLTITDHKDMKGVINNLIARLSLSPKLIMLVVEELPRLLLTTPRRQRADIKQLLITTVATARKNGFSTVFVSQLLDFIPDECLGLGTDWILFRNVYRVNKIWGYVCSVREDKKDFIKQVKGLPDFSCLHIDITKRTNALFIANEYVSALSDDALRCEKCGSPIGDPTTTWDMNGVEMGQFTCSDCGASFKAPVNQTADLLRTRSLTFDAKAIISKPWSMTRKAYELSKRGLEPSMIADLLETNTNSVSVMISRAKKSAHKRRK